MRTVIRFTREVMAADRHEKEHLSRDHQRVPLVMGGLQHS